MNRLSVALEGKAIEGHSLRGRYEGGPDKPLYIEIFEAGNTSALEIVRHQLAKMALNSEGSPSQDTTLLLKYIPPRFRDFQVKTGVYA